MPRKLTQTPEIANTNQNAMAIVLTVRQWNFVEKRAMVLVKKINVTVCGQA